MAMSSTYTDDGLLWTAFLQGETLAERAVFHAYFKPLCLYAERITGQLETAEDIVAEAFEKAWSRRQDFPSRDNLKAFLYRVVHNAAINHNLAARRHDRAHTRIAYIAAQEMESEPAMDREILRVELLQEIYEEIEQLPDRCGQIFKLIFLHDRSTEEIAAELGINPQTVRSQKSRAIQLIKTQLLKKNRIVTLLLLTTILEVR
jgi:RNA polymerase sigma-70 factor (family 1)